MSLQKTSPDSSLRDLIDHIPGYDPFADCGGCLFDLEAGLKPIEFFEEILTHERGEMAGKPLVVEPWQRAILANLFGWKRPDGTRRYREAFIFVPRKNGKTVLAAGIGVFLLFCDNEPGAEIYCAACEKGQASILHNFAKYQVEQQPELSKRADVFKENVVIKDSTSFFRVLSSKPRSKHGYNAHCVIIDELHALQSGELVDVLTSSMGARRQPLTIYITTSDYDRPDSVCNAKYEYARKVRDGAISDSAFLPVIYEATNRDDWHSPETWKKANPNFGVSVLEDFLQSEHRKAAATPAYENTFKRLYLNLKTEQDQRWLSMDRWDDCKCLTIEEDTLLHSPCFMGIDLSSTQDITAVVLAFVLADGNYFLRPFFWYPEKRAEKAERSDAVPYLTWAREEFLTLTSGDVIDYKVVRAKIVDLCNTYQVQQIGADPWNAQQLLNELSEDYSLPVVKFSQSMASMNEPTKRFEVLIASRGIVHDGNPILRWMASAVSVKFDQAGNIRPTKKKGSVEKNDGIVASIMAVALASLHNRTSVYESRGIEVF